MRQSNSNLPRLCAAAVVGIGLWGARVPGGRAAEPSRNVVIVWNVAALETTAAAPFNPPLETRNLAIVHAAVFDAANAVSGTYRPYAAGLRPDPSASIEAAVAAAAHATLVRLYPARRAVLDEALEASLALITDDGARKAGVSLGEEAATRILALRAGDGADVAVGAAHTPGNDPGAWRPTPPDSLPALDPGWATVTPFVLPRGAAYRPEPPAPLASPLYARDLREVQAIGSATSALRTPAQTDLAHFWVETAAQHWNAAARQVALARRRPLIEDARAFALLNLAGADAFIAAWDAKFAYGQWRPITAIAAAGEDGNPETTADPRWTPLLVTPPFPDYVAGHTAYAGAAETALVHVFGRDPGIVMALTSRTAPGVVLRYTSFEEMAEGVVDARVWGGIHWRTSCTRGRSLGQRVGAHVVGQVLVPAQAVGAGSRRPRAAYAPR
jgi:hypothetical protein